MRTWQVMTREVVTVRATTTVEEIARLLTARRISAVPVVDDERRVVGIVSESDLFLKQKGIPFSAVKAPALFNEWVDPARLPEIYANARRHTAADVMTRAVVCAQATDEVGQVALLMTRRGIERVPVLQDGRLVGIIARSDLVRLLADPRALSREEPAQGADSPPVALPSAAGLKD